MKSQRIVIRLLSNLVCAIATWSSASSSAADTAPPFLEIQSEQLDAAGPATLGTVDSTLSIARDGAADLRSVQRDALQATSFTTNLLRGPASAPEFKALRLALAAAQPRSFPAVCIGPPLPLGSDRRIRLIWYSQNQRASRTDIGFSAGESCPAGLNAVLEAADALARALPAQASTAIGSSPCATDRQCVSGLKCCYPGGIPGLVNVCMRPADSGQCFAFP